MAKIIAPNKQYTGVSAGVPFVNGIGETADPHLIDWFRTHGYAVEEPPPKEKTVDEMTLPELKDMAAKLGIELDAADKKADVLAKVKAALEAKNDNGGGA